MPTTLVRRVAAPTIGTLLAGVVLVLGAAPYVHAAGGQETVDVAVPGRVACADGTGTDLGADPALAVGDRITCTLAGFGASEQVDVTVNGTRQGTVTTDDKGGGRYDFTVPAGLAAGAYALTFTGETSHAVGTYPFRVTAIPPATTAPAGGGTGGGTGGGGSSGGLAFTGANVLLPVGAGLLLVAAGVGLAVANRRRAGRRT